MCTAGKGFGNLVTLVRMKLKLELESKCWDTFTRVHERCGYINFLCIS